MATRNPFEDDGADLVPAAESESRPADFSPAQEAELASQDAYLSDLRPAEGSGVKVVQPMSFMSLEEASKLNSTDYTIKWLLPARGVVLIYGEPAVGKSFTMLSTGIHIAECWTFGGRRVRRRPVYILSLEGSGGLGKRIQAFKAWARMKGKPELKGDVRFCTQGFALNDPDQCDALIKAIIDAGHQGAVVIIDTLSQATVGLDENSSQMAEAISNATRIAETIGGLVVLVHHVGKVAANGPRGHSSLMGNVDCAIYVRKAPVGKGAEWTVTKSKDDADGQTVGFKLHIVELGLDADGDKVTSCAAEPCLPSKPEKSEKPKASAVAEVLKPRSAADRCFKTFLTALHEVKTEGVHLEDWRPFYYAKSTASSQHSKSSQFSAQRNQLVELGVLTVDNDVYSLTQDFRRRMQADTAARDAATQHS